MIKTIFLLVLTTAVSGTVLTRNQRSKDVDVKSHYYVIPVKGNPVNVIEWKELWKTTEFMVTKNAYCINAMKAKRTLGQKTFDDLFEGRTITLETKNADLQKAIETYEPVQGDFEAFKEKLTTDMESLSEDIKAYVVDYDY